MPPVLPSSLSPHICVLCSPDLELLLRSASLPPLPQLLRSFSPLFQVTTRTTTLTSVTHSSFPLRFSDLVEIEEACKEDEEERANRTIDWIGSRISQKSSEWVETMEQSPSEGFTTPWWEELKKCSEGDHVPSRHEGWNHPVAVIFAVSTTDPNPLQALQDLHSRQIELQSWVDPTHLRCSLIVHPQNSSLSEPITDSLFNAVKKQHGLHSYLLRLSLPTPPPPAIPVSALLPRLPSADPNRSSTQLPESNSDYSQEYNLKATDVDLQATSKFVREFTVMSLIPWMEKCVLDWNDNYSSSRRLPSRLFSSTRRLFGSSSVAVPVSPQSSTFPVPSHTSTSSQTSVSSVTSVGPPAQQRRLAEFATILGDYKLAISIWESVRKEGRGGSEVLPLLLTPSPAVSLHASHAIKSLHPTSDLPSHAQLRALKYSVRWDIGINKEDFIGDLLEGEQWFVWAAGSADEPPAALLLAQAAHLSLRKGSRRRSALWYLFAAGRLEKYGIKPLTTYLLRRAHMLYQIPPAKALSPSFWESEEKDPKQWKGFTAVIPGIEHALGRLLYTTGDTEGAVRFFLGLLLGSPSPSLLASHSSELSNGDASLGNRENTDKVYLDDFRVAFKHLIATSSRDLDLTSFKLPLRFSVAKQTKVRLQSDSHGEDLEEWKHREESWRTFWKTRGKESLDNKRTAAVGETLWVDFVLHNPLDAEVQLMDVTVVVREAGIDDVASTREYLDVEVIDRIVLAARETRTVPIQVRALRPATLTFSEFVYRFFALLPCAESLAVRGKRLNGTAIERQGKLYAKDEFVEVEAQDCGQRVQATFRHDGPLSVAQGERRLLNLWLSNTGAQDINELWLVTGQDDEIWIDLQDESSSKIVQYSEIMHSNNSISSQEPIPIPLERFVGSSFLSPGSSFELPVIFHAHGLVDQNLCLMFVFRKAGGTFSSTKVVKSYQVIPMFEISMSSSPSRNENHLFLLNIEIQNTTAFVDLEISQITTMSGTWSCTSTGNEVFGDLTPQQLAHAAFNVAPWEDSGDGPQRTRDFVRQKLGATILGQDLELTKPPPLELLCSHFSKEESVRSANNPKLSHFIYTGKRTIVTSALMTTHPSIPQISYPYLFPLNNPSSLDVILFWEIKSERRSGHVLISGLRLGAGHSELQGLIEEAESTKVKRSMYAETHREKMEVLESIRKSEWNANDNPIVVNIQECAVVKHDFATGPCSAPVTFVFTNCSLTRVTRFVFRLGSDPGVYPPSSGILPPQYTGRRTFRGAIEPSQVTQVHTQVWITHPGSYSLDGWRLESDVEKISKTNAKHTFIQGPSSSGGQSCITVVSI